MRSLRPHAARSHPDLPRRRLQLTRSNVDLRLEDRTTFSFAVPRIVDSPVVIEEKRWVHREDVLLYPNRIGPRPLRVGGGHEEAPTPAHVRRHEIEGALVMAKGRCIDPLGTGESSEVQ